MKTLILSLFVPIALGGLSSCGTASNRGAIQAPVAKVQYSNSSEAARALLENLNMKVVLSTAIEQTLDAQILANPQIASMKPTMMAFMNKYMSWEALADDMIQLYVDVYTQEELEDLIEFYQSEVGKKSIQLMPELMKKGSELGQRRVQEHIGELQQMLLDSQK